jgi:hypothetical protein
VSFQLDHPNTAKRMIFAPNFAMAEAQLVIDPALPYCVGRMVATGPGKALEDADGEKL